MFIGLLFACTGSPWCPRSPSGKIALLISLIFALVIYNAYAGFITSILSVQAAGIKSLADLLLNNYKLGYSANDEEYIRVGEKFATCDYLPLIHITC